MPPRLPSARVLASKRPTTEQPSICLQCLFQYRPFSNTPTLEERKVKGRQKLTRAQRTMRSWVYGAGQVFEQPLEGATNYLGAYDKSGNLIRKASAAGADKENKAEGEEDSAGDAETSAPESLEDLRPFPANPYFRSEAVLSVRFREEIYRRVKDRGQTIRQVSVDLNVTMERVAAVYRMKEIEKRRIQQNQPLFLRYQHVVMDMLPQTKYNPETRLQRHESINDLPVHPSTLKQLFHPTSESRHFTRVDAGRVFHPDLKPADDRIPHPEMIEAAKDFSEGFTQSQRQTRMGERFVAMEEATKEKERKRKEAEAMRTTTIEGKRWNFKFRDVSSDVDVVGPEGRGRKAVGWRYGQPFEDRKKGQVKIPTQVN